MPIFLVHFLLMRLKKNTENAAADDRNAMTETQRQKTHAERMLWRRVGNEKTTENTENIEIQGVLKSSLHCPQ